MILYLETNIILIAVKAFVYAYFCNLITIYIKITYDYLKSF